MGIVHADRPSWGVWMDGTSDFIPQKDRTEIIFTIFRGIYQWFTNFWIFLLGSWVPFLGSSKPFFGDIYNDIYKYIYNGSCGSIPIYIYIDLNHEAKWIVWIWKDHIKSYSTTWTCFNEHDNLTHMQHIERKTWWLQQEWHEDQWTLPRIGTLKVTPFELKRGNATH
jgi:hypothetical protein